VLQATRAGCRGAPGGMGRGVSEGWPLVQVCGQRAGRKGLLFFLSAYREVDSLLKENVITYDKRTTPFAGRWHPAPRNSVECE